MGCANNASLPHFLPLLGKILVLRVLPAYRKKIGCFPLNPRAPAARGGYKTLGQAQENAVSVSDVTLMELLSLSLKLEMVSIYLAGESFYVLHKFIYVLK